MPINPNPPVSAGGGGGFVGGIGTLRATVALPAGASNDLLPAIAWPLNYGRLVLTAGGGAANVTGLVAGLDPQWLLIFNDDPANNVTLNSENLASAVANRFHYFADLVLPPGASVWSVYDAGVSRWLLT